ncbi:MAG: phosphoribosylformylglycinamidine synthase subunit PurQ [Gemmatimonadales bacterium]|nr:MAG: phosphoribosylformylglycinamidine synthase subunit PurQ [Gemmatimonadales bacterium]
MIRVAVIRFPGSNCDEDTLRAFKLAGADAYFVWHRERSLHGADIVVLPGGFAFGDYLRAGAIARFSPVMDAVCRHAREGGPVLGICNGFQVLCEANLLPGALARNAGLTFVSRPVRIRVEATDTPFTRLCPPGAIFTLPVAHGEGRYVAPPELIEELESEGRVVLRYVEGSNPNGSANDIAGITNRERNVVGMMPHPERAVDPLLGSAEGFAMFVSAVQSTALTSGGAP